jgi:hypothetical protein
MKSRQPSEIHIRRAFARAKVHSHAARIRMAIKPINSGFMHGSLSSDEGI